MSVVRCSYSAGWHEEQKPDCKTPKVCSHLLSSAGTLDEEATFLESPLNKADETGAGQISENRGAPCHVLARFDHCWQHPRLLEVDERHGT